MNISEFISQYKNHPVLFVGAGLSSRYYENTYTWDALLCKICQEVHNDSKYYNNLKAKYYENDTYRYDKIAGELEKISINILLKTLMANLKILTTYFMIICHKGHTLH